MSERFIAELQRLYPLTYHRRHPGETGFRAKMERLLRLNGNPSADTGNGYQPTGGRRGTELGLPAIEARRTTTGEDNVTGSGSETEADRSLLNWLVEAIVTVLGIILAMVPLALWFAWSKEVYYVVLGVCGGSFAAIYLIGRFGPAQTPAQPAKRRVLSPQFIARLHRLMGRSLP